MQQITTLKNMINLKVELDLDLFSEDNLIVNKCSIYRSSEDIFEKKELDDLSRIIESFFENDCNKLMEFIFNEVKRN